MQRADVWPDISERVLAQVITGVEGAYDRYGYLPEMVERILRTIDLVK
jgi:hypothetical protein